MIKTNIQSMFKRLLVLCVAAGSSLAFAGYYVYSSGVTSPPDPGANQHTIDFGTVTVVTEDTANRITYSNANGAASGFGTSAGSVSFSVAGPGGTGFSGNALRLRSGTTSNATTATINFDNPTPYLGMMWRAQFNAESTQILTLTLSGGSTKVLKNCTSEANSECIGMYVDSPSWLSGLLEGLFGWLFGSSVDYHSIYVQYTPDSGVKVTKAEFKVLRCAGCGSFLSPNPSQDFFIDNLSFVDGAAVPHHLEMTTSSSSVAANVATAVRVKACGDAACTTKYITGASGTISVVIGGVTNTTAAWTIPAGPTNYVDVNITPTTAGTATLSTTYSPTPSNTPKVFCGIGVAAASGNSCDVTVTQPVHHVRLTTSSSTALTCSPVTYTITACSNADCSSLNTAGLTGNLSVSGVTTNYPSTAAFTIAGGSSSTTVSAHMTTVGTGTATLTGLSKTPTNTPTIFCGIGVAAASGNACGITVASSALLVSIPDHYSDASATATITAVKASDNSASCTPAFASVSKNVTLKCTYTNPATGTKAVRVGGTALNAGNNAASACDGTGQSVSLSFNASGVATPTLQYADVGSMGLSATYTGSGSDAGLSMTGSDSFIVAPYYFDVAGPGAGNIKAGNNFSGTVTARNLSGAATPNFGKESSAEGVTLAFVRTLPSGTSAVNGSFSGSVGAFNAGAATGSNLAWTEVGRGDVSATLTDAGNDGYLGSGLKSAGSTAGWAVCAAEGANCVLPTGATAYVAYGANGFYAMATGVTGTIACTNGVFGDPISGVVKSCLYLVTSGAAPGVAGGVGPFTPDHFDVETTNGCGTFTYGGFTTAGATTLTGQPFSVTVRARNAAGNTTANYDGSLNTSPNYAKATTLLFADSKLRAATAITVRATDTDSVTSNGATEGTIALRSGRIKVSNAFGSEKSTLQVPVQAQYWSGSAWVLNAADSCTSILANSVALSNYLDHKGAATAAWTTTPSAVTITGGNGTLTLTAPNPAGSVGSVDFALNLGTAGTDGSCQITPRPASTAGNQPWLRAQNGSGNNCSDATHTRDPSARATFGVYKPESKKTVFTRELY